MRLNFGCLLLCWVSRTCRGTDSDTFLDRFGKTGAPSPSKKLLPAPAGAFTLSASFRKAKAVIASIGISAISFVTLRAQSARANWGVSAVMHKNGVAHSGLDIQLTPLIGMIYEAVESPALWPIILDQIAEAVRGRETILFASFHDPAKCDISSIARMNPATLVPYVEHYASVNVLSVRCDPMFPDGTTRYSHRAMPDAEFEQTEFYNDYFMRYNMHYSFGLKVPLGDFAPAYLACMRPKRSGPFEDTEGAILEMLMPHLQRALRLHLQFSQLRANAKGLEFALDAFDRAVFGLDGTGRVVLSNRIAEQLAKYGDGIALNKNRIVASIVHQNADLQALISSTISTVSTCFQGGALLLGRKSGKPPLRVTVVPCASTLLPQFGQLAVLVFVDDPTLKPLARSTTLRTLYGLSPTECRVADLLGSGYELTAAAEMLHLKYEAARFHLKSILRKTGAHRQSELIRLIAGLPGDGIATVVR